MTPSRENGPTAMEQNLVQREGEIMTQGNAKLIAEANAYVCDADGADLIGRLVTALGVEPESDPARARVTVNTYNITTTAPEPGPWPESALERILELEAELEASKAAHWAACASEAKLSFEASRVNVPDTHLTLANAADAIASVVHGWEGYMESTKPWEQAEAIRRLQDAVSDLSTWHPLYDSDTGKIEDDEYDGGGE